VKKQNSGDGHDRRATGQNGGDGRKRTAFLKEQEKCDRAGPDADSGENRIENSLLTRLLIPTVRQPKKREIN